LTVADRGADVLPERVRPRGEPTEESDRETTGNTRRKAATSRTLTARSRPTTMEEEHPEDADSSLSVGYTDVAHLDGGINAWKEQGKPVEDSSG
jgi:hypothetical protein